MRLQGLAREACKCKRDPFPLAAPGSLFAWQIQLCSEDELGMWVSKDMYTPQRASYGLTDFIFNGFFNTVAWHQ